jgi:uncharacterized protein YegL
MNLVSCFTVVCAAGKVELIINVLKQITGHVVSLDTADSASIGKFFQWVTASWCKFNESRRFWEEGYRLKWSSSI